MHFDPMPGAIVESAMPEPRQIEVRTKVTVDDAKHVQIEFGGHSGRVIVCGLDDPDILPQVCAEQEMVKRMHLAGDSLQNLHGFPLPEIPDRAAEKSEQSGTCSMRKDELTREIRHCRIDAHSWVFTSQTLGCVAQKIAADIHRHVLAGASRISHRVEDHARLACASGTELDKRRRSEAGNESRHNPAQKRPLGPRRIVLGELRNRFEEPGSALIVEIFRVELLLRARQTGAHILQKPVAIGRQSDLAGCYFWRTKR